MVSGTDCCSCACHVARVPLHAVSGVTLYFSDFKRSLTDKLAKDFFTEPSQVGVHLGSTTWRGNHPSWHVYSASCDALAVRTMVLTLMHT